MRLLVALLLLLPAACRKAPAPAPSAPVDYRPADGSFSARVPGDWRVEDAPGESRKAAFFGPPAGPAPFSDLMGVYYHAAAEPGTAARAYVASQTGHGPGLTPPLGVSPAAGLDDSFTRAAPAGHGGPGPSVVTRVVAVPVSGGFYTLEHTWPADRAPDPAFEELLRSFKPAATK
ncbi:MAG: hypothetical protein HY079_13345 [Elusimicrobia bacterium]|nr:hypothetical protein [Elusimicrobiota bacterium]